MSKRHQLGIAKCLAIARSQIISVMYKRERERENPCVVEGFCKDPGVE